MIFQIENILRDVRVALDQNVVSRQLIATDDIDTLSLDELIESKIIDAVKLVEMQVPTHMLDSGHNFGDAVYWGDMKHGWTILPDDFMRLVVFKMSDWERSLYSAISETAPEYEQQSSRFAGIRGTVQKPVCAIVSRPQGKVLEFWSCKSEEAKVGQAVYVPLPRIDENGGVEICERCYRAVVYYAGALTAQALGGDNAGKGLLEIAKELMEQRKEREQ